MREPPSAFAIFPPRDCTARHPPIGSQKTIQEDPMADIDRTAPRRRHSMSAI